MATSAKIAAAKQDWRQVVAAFKREFGITLPKALRVKFHENQGGIRDWGGSHFCPADNELNLYTDYPPLLGDRAAIYAHELGHAFEHNFKLTRFADWKAHFAEPAPDDYEEINTTLTRLKMWASPRPYGEPSVYGQKMGGEERFCEVLRLMYQNGFTLPGKFSDIEDLWDAAGALLVKCRALAKTVKAPKIKPHKARLAKSKALVFDLNECPMCRCAARCYDLYYTHCAAGHELVQDAAGGIALWRLGEVDSEVLGGICSGLEKLLRIPVVLQPALVDRRPGEMKAWCEDITLDADILLKQIQTRHQPDSVFTLLLTEDNIAPTGYNFLFGYAWMPGHGAVVSLDALRSEGADTAQVIERSLKICVHELGHNLGLDHHDYEEDIDCVMTGDEEEDSLDSIDSGTWKFCAACQKKVNRALRQTLKPV